MPDNYSNPEMMNIYEAIEAMKIIGRYQKEIESSKTIIVVVRQLLRTAELKNDTLSILRLLALMEHKNVEELIKELVDANNGMEYASRLGNGLVINPIAELLNNALMLDMASSQRAREV